MQTGWNDHSAKSSRVCLGLPMKSIHHPVLTPSPTGANTHVIFPSSVFLGRRSLMSTLKTCFFDCRCQLEPRCRNTSFHVPPTLSTICLARLSVFSTVCFSAATEINNIYPALSVSDLHIWNHAESVPPFIMGENKPPTCFQLAINLVKTKINKTINVSLYYFHLESKSKLTLASPALISFPTHRTGTW